MESKLKISREATRKRRRYDKSEQKWRRRSFFFQCGICTSSVMCHRSGTHGGPFLKPSLQETSASTRNEGRTFDNEVEPGACSTIGFIGDSEALRQSSSTRGVCTVTSRQNERSS